VVGFDGDEVMLMPFAAVQGLLPGTGVRVVTHTARVGVGDQLLGRVVDGLGLPLDGGGLIDPDVYVPLRGERKNPLQRAPIDQVLDVGVRAINSLLTIGRGQRIGLIAGSGVGKSMLLGMMTRFTAADIVVVGMIGERGREVLDFVTETLGPEGRQRAVVVAAPGDCSPVVRLRATHYTCAIAEYFRDQGKNVLLLMDSLTRVAHAQREVGLAVGEPPTTKGYTPSVFSMINELVERAGSVAAGGSITGIYTILAEGDDANDPIVDGARAILDGHVLLSRDLAALGQYPAIDINLSVSRLANKLVTADQRVLVRKFRRLMATWEENRDLVAVGAYRPGTNADLDEALQRRGALRSFLQQDSDEKVDFDGGFGQLAGVLA
jgi:flagellum-specific ATP synthase